MCHVQKLALLKSAGILCCTLCFPPLVSAQEDDLMRTGIALPAELKNGTATLAQAREWVAQETRYFFPGVSSDELLSGSENPDLNLDGNPDLLIERYGGGTGGSVFSAFETTSSGYRYIGTFMGVIRPVRVSTGRPRAVIGTHNGGGQSIVQLVELGSNGMRQLAKTTLATGDSGTVDGNRQASALFAGSVATEAAVREVFGP